MTYYLTTILRSCPRCSARPWSPFRHYCCTSLRYGLESRWPLISFFLLTKRCIRRLTVQAQCNMQGNEWKKIKHYNRRGKEQHDDEETTKYHRACQNKTSTHLAIDSVCVQSALDSSEKKAHWWHQPHAAKDCCIYLSSEKLTYHAKLDAQRSRHNDCTIACYGQIPGLLENAANTRARAARRRGDICQSHVCAANLI